MYCPKCATQNAEDTKFCRSCGTNLSLVPQALTGRLPDAPSERHRGRHRRRDRNHEPANLANGITKAFTGVGFLLVSFAIFFFGPAGHDWWFWLLIPAFATLGKGIAEIVSARYGPHLTPGMNQTAMPAGARIEELPARNEVLFPPPSVTEQTTRQLDPSTGKYRYRDTDAH